MPEGKKNNSFVNKFYTKFYTNILVETNWKTMLIFNPTNLLTMKVLGLTVNLRIIPMGLSLIKGIVLVNLTISLNKC